MFLLAVQYYFNADAYLIDPAVMPLTPGGAIGISLVTLAGGWLVYDLLCRSPIGRQRTGCSALASSSLIVGAAWLFSQVFSGRGALIHVGAFVGTIMAANVFMVIIPEPGKMTAQLLAGEAPDPRIRAGRQAALTPQQLSNTARAVDDGLATTIHS